MQEKVGLFVSRNVLSDVAYNELKIMGFIPVAFSFGTKLGYPEEVVLDFGDIEGFGRQIAKCRIRKLVFAGKIEPSALFKKRISDSGRIFLEGIRNLNPENILKSLVSFFLEKKIELIPLTKVFRRHIAKTKIYTESGPDSDQWKDICAGWKAAKAIARCGIGQAVAIKNGMIIGVEAIEGTDNMIKRAGNFCDGFSVIKVIKSGQDVRFDLPTIGPDTIRNLARAGGRVIAVESNRAIILEQQKTKKIANKNHIIVLGFKGKEIR
ncbi:MAG: LpxI family protein [Candidatus Omnitrophica bacterium]|nr:LpxI family protein [Candidatus Omnitrophota bacterium]MCM8828320.1 LpxI family protein [Candidatus Omnitrophota bacterium]